MPDNPIKTPTSFNLLTEREAAEFLGLKPATLRQSRWTGTLAGVAPPIFVRMGRNIRYRFEDLNTWLEQFNEVAQ